MNVCLFQLEVYSYKICCNYHGHMREFTFLLSGCNIKDQIRSADAEQGKEVCSRDNLIPISISGIVNSQRGYEEKRKHQEVHH